MQTVTKIQFFDLPKFYQLFSSNYKKDAEEKLGTVYSAYGALCDLGFSKLANATLNKYPADTDLTRSQVAEFVDEEWVDDVYNYIEITAQNARKSLKNG